MRERNLHWVREEKCFQSSIRNCKKYRADMEWCLALDREVARNRSRQFLASENQGEKQAEEWRCLELDTSRFETTSACFHSTFSWRKSARLKTFFLTSQRDEARSNFGQHGTSNSRRKPEIDTRFQLVSHLRFIVLWIYQNLQNLALIMSMLWRDQLESKAATSSMVRWCQISLGDGS
jgi:hypothetical protein